MPSVKLNVPNPLGQDAAVERLKTFLDKVRDKYQSQVSDLQQSWADNVLSYSFKTFGMQIKGTMAVEPQQVQLDATIPFAAIAFKGKIEQTLRDELTKVLS